MELKIEYLDKQALKPYANNAKVHTAEQVEQIKNSIREFGFNDPIAVWHDNEIIEGHGRLLAAMEMEDIKTVPVIRLDDLTDEQRRAYMLAHNKLTMNTDFDLDLLSTEIADLVDGFDLTDFGFNEREILELTIDDSPEEIPVAVPQVQPQPYEGGQVPQMQAGAIIPQIPAGTPNFGAEGQAPVSREDLSMYERQANQLVTRRVIIVYRTDEEEAYLKQMLGAEVDKPLGVVYDAGNLMREATREGVEDGEEESAD